MTLSIIAVELFDLADHGVAITGDVPTGLFSIGLPGIGWSDTGQLLIGALAVVFVGYSETLAAARSVARKYRYELDTNQELIAQGMANGAAGLVGGFVVDGSLSKTSVADDAGQKTEVASLINAVFILATMLFLATLFENLPGATLGAVVIDAMVGLITLNAFQRYYRVSRTDWLFFMGAGLGILFFGIMAGILIGVTLSLLMLIADARRRTRRFLDERHRLKRRASSRSCSIVRSTRNTGLFAGTRCSASTGGSTRKTAAWCCTGSAITSERTRRSIASSAIS